MRERDIENYLREQVKKIGGRAYKFESPGNAGVPDRLILLPRGRVEFVELKAPGKKPTALQIAQHRKFEKLGQNVLVIDSKEKVDEFIARVGEAECQQP
ncbi:MAG: VRR-NUC domain-containing protein [Bacillaceae bacterium]|nr:VRR-NUC domain-containing protein [Bacillaceae bacterium]